MSDKSDKAKSNDAQVKRRKEILRLVQCIEINADRLSRCRVGLDAAERDFKGAQNQIHNDRNSLQILLNTEFSGGQ